MSGSNEMQFSGFDEESKNEFAMKRLDDDHKRLSFFIAFLVGGAYEGKVYKGSLIELREDVLLKIDALDKKLTPYIDQCDECLVEKEEHKNDKKDTKRSLRDNVLFAIIAGLTLFIASSGWQKIMNENDDQKKVEKRMALIMKRLDIDTTSIGR